MYRARLQAKLKANSHADPDTGCWEWQGQISNSGRGRIMIQDKGMPRTVSAEDASYIAFFGEIPAKSLVRHACGNCLCMNPEHLELMQRP